MRIIAGHLKGKKLTRLTNNHIRPTSNRLRETLFNILNNYYDDFASLVFLDMFAGTGALGIEAISRGAQKVYFLEKNFKSLAIIKANLRIIQNPNQAIVYHLDSTTGTLKNITKPDIVFLDPPYNQNLIKKAIQNLQKFNLINSNTLLIIEKDKRELIELELNILKLTNIGDSTLIFAKLL